MLSSTRTIFFFLKPTKCGFREIHPVVHQGQYLPRMNNAVPFARSLAGMSRSVTVAVAYIMSTTNLSWKDALKVVRVGRSVANPNVGFQQQLEDFESSRLQDVRL